MNRSLFDTAVVVATILLLVLGLLVPLILIATYTTPAGAGSARHSSEVMVGIAVLLRAATRRVLRTGARGVMRTTVSTVTRTVARTITRRMLRMSLRSAAAATVKQGLGGQEGIETDGARRPGRSLVSVATGVLALSASFAGVLWVLGAVGAEIVQECGLPAWALCALAGLPMLLYAVLVWAAAAWLSLPIRFVTTFEGLLVQGYFTGAGSFLPMTTDVELEGSPKKKAQAACTALLGLYLLHLAAAAGAAWTGSPWLSVTAGMLLVYCFVYAFPIKPMEGYTIFAYRKTLWIGVFAPIVISFALSLPESLQRVL